METRFHTLGRHSNIGQWQVSGESFKIRVVTRPAASVLLSVSHFPAYPHAYESSTLCFSDSFIAPAA